MVRKNIVDFRKVLKYIQVLRWKVAKGWRNPDKNLYLGLATFNLFQNSCFDVIENVPTKPGGARSSHFEKAISFLIIPVWFRALLVSHKYYRRPRWHDWSNKIARCQFDQVFLLIGWNAAGFAQNPIARCWSYLPLADERLNRATDFFSRSGQEWSDAIFGHADV